MNLIIPKEVEERIHGYVMSVETEIAGMGKVAVSPDGESITVTEVMIYEQDVTGATADLSPQAIAKWQTELVKKGESPKHWKLWWHSHANMQAFFSGRDTATIDQQTEGDWMVSLVVNKRREREARLDLYRPFRMYLEDIDIQIGTEAEAAYQVPADIAAEVAAKVKRSVPITYSKPYSLGFKYDNNTKDYKTGIDFHRYCPMFTKDEKRCYHPYGMDNTGVNADCTAQKFKEIYGSNPFMPEVPESTEVEGIYSRDELVAMTKQLEAQIDDFENRGMGDSAECLELTSELVDFYYELAEVETNETVAEAVREQARQLENVLYALEDIPEVKDF